MHEIIKFLEDNPVQYLASTGQDGKPKVRPFQFQLESGEKLFFCTSNKKSVYQDLMVNPNLELCVASPDNVWVRIAGKAVFLNDMGIKAAVIEKSPLVKSIYKTSDNPVFEIFYLANAEAVVSDFSGQPPKHFKL
jgi:uncharacterized pyridoxamine 5'-phosphate oxidase family protein